MEPARLHGIFVPMLTPLSADETVDEVSLRRLVDFLMEDISSYSDEQVGAAVRDVQRQSRSSLERYLRLAPVIDGVEGTFTKIDAMDAAAVKLVGNVPASGQAPGGMLRHRGWKAERVDLPAAGPGSVLAPAELEIE